MERQMTRFGRAYARYCSLLLITGLLLLGVGCIDTQPPTAPTELSATYDSSRLSATLSWTAATDNIAVTGYNIYRNGVLVGQAETTTYTDALAGPEPVSYTVTAVDRMANSPNRARA